MSIVQERDYDTAEEFLSRTDCLDVIDKYIDEFDSELRDDAVKAAMYCIYRERGMDPTFAAMNACRRAPGAANVDRHFSEKARSRMENMGEYNRDEIVKLARKAGISTQGRFYCGGLGRYTDQHAWVSTADDLLNVAKKRNLTVTGAVKHQGRELPPPKPVALAEDIVRKKTAETLAREPATAEKVRKNPKKLREVRERVIAKHGRQRK